MENIKRTFGDLLTLIKSPLITEKSVSLVNRALNRKQYSFIVDKSMTKEEIKYVIEKIFNVKIFKINTMILPRKKKRVGKFIGNKAVYKKAYISLNEGYLINNIFN
jgi:large subunit ribosomal protein L23